MDPVVRTCVMFALLFFLVSCSGVTNPSARQPAASSKPAKAAKAADAVPLTAQPSTVETLATPSQDKGTLQLNVTPNTVELVPDQSPSGNVGFDIYNQSGQRITVSLVQTEKKPDTIRAKDGRVDKSQLGATVIAELSVGQYEPGRLVEMSKQISEPGQYLVVVTATDSSTPKAYTTLTVTAN